ncbi:hypothetical protein BH18ACT9_BH18ACT9_01460 [soil metagenome]
MAQDLDAHVADFRTQPLGAGPYTFVAADALTTKAACATSRCSSPPA